MSRDKGGRENLCSFSFLQNDNEVHLAQLDCMKTLLPVANPGRCVQNSGLAGGVKEMEEGM